MYPAPRELGRSEGNPVENQSPAHPRPAAGTGTARAAKGPGRRDIRRLGFILTENYSLMPVAAAVEPLRAANLLAGRTLYETSFLSARGGMILSTAGGGFDTTAFRDAPFDYDIVFVIAGGNPMVYEDAELIRYLRRLNANRVPLGGLSGGSAIMARAGLMEGRRFTVHWQHIAPLLDLDPDFRIERRLFVIDRDRYSCAGGVAVLDMMCAIIESDHGAAFARSISDWFIYANLRNSDVAQEASLTHQYGIRHPALAAALGIMVSHMTDPLTPAQLSMLSGISLRQLHRLFSEHFGMPMMAVYRNLRLEKADELLQQSLLPILEIGLMTGFPNAAHFSRVFAQRYGITPGERRRAGRARNLVSEAPSLRMPEKFVEPI